MWQGLADRRISHGNTKPTSTSGIAPCLEQRPYCWSEATAEIEHVWAIRVRLEMAENHRDLALFNMAIDSKLTACELVKMKVVDVMAYGQIKERTSVLQSKTQKTVHFEISESTITSVVKWMKDDLMIGFEYLWPGRFHERLHMSTRA